jgi:hypothetical protein
MKHGRALGLAVTTAVVACLAAWLTPQQEMQASSSSPQSLSDDEWRVPVVFGVR